MQHLQAGREVARPVFWKRILRCRCGAGGSSADAGEWVSAMQSWSGGAVRMRGKGFLHCSCGARLQCGSRRRVKCTAGAERDCSAEAGEGSRALQLRSGIAVRKLEIGQVHCRRKPERQCGSQKTSKSTATAERDCSAEAGDRARALSQEEEKTV